MSHVGELKIGLVVADRPWHASEQYLVLIERADAVGELGVDDG